MKIAIVGAGIIGVTTAWELASDGHEVAVFERRGAAAEEASFANAGVVAPGYVTPWAAPGMRLKVLRSLLSSHGAIKLRWPLSSRDLGWMSRWQKACKLETYLANRARMQRLAFYSRTRLHEVSEARELSYERSDGYLVLLRSKRERKLVQPGLEVLRGAGSVFREVDADEARLIEPAPQSRHRAGRRDLPARGRGRQLPPVRTVAQVGGRGTRRAVPFQLRHRAAEPGRAHFGVAGERLRCAALRCGGGLRRARLGLAAAPARPADPDGAGLWALGERAGARAAQCAAQRDHGRALQGRDLAPRPARARGRQRRDRRLGRHAEPARDPHALQGAAGLVPGRGDLAVGRAAVERRTADAARRAAGARRERHSGRVGSTWAMAPAAGPCRAAARAWWPT
jgi:hypothetical protein